MPRNRVTFENCSSPIVCDIKILKCTNLAKFLSVAFHLSIFEMTLGERRRAIEVILQTLGDSSLCTIGSAYMQYSSMFISNNVDALFCRFTAYSALFWKFMVLFLLQFTEEFLDAMPVYASAHFTASPATVTFPKSFSSSGWITFAWPATT